VKVPLVFVVVFRRDYAAIKHGKIDGVFHFADFAPREIVRETRSRCHLLLSMSILFSLFLPALAAETGRVFCLFFFLSLFSLSKEEEDEED